jgi:hypothetical protein
MKVDTLSKLRLMFGLLYGKVIIKLGTMYELNQV